MTICPFILKLILIGTAETLCELNGEVKQIKSVDVEIYGTHLVDCVSLNVMFTLLLVRSQGKFVPVSVKLSPPRGFNCFAGII